MNFRRFIVFYRIPVAVALIALGFWSGFAVTWWIAWIPFLVALVMIAAYFMVGPMTLIQGYMEQGDMEGAQKLLDKVKFPNLLYKPIRSSYYMLRANFSTMGENLDQAEADLRKGLAAGMPEKEYEGTAYLQLGSIAYKKGNMKEAMENLRKAIKTTRQLLICRYQPSLCSAGISRVQKCTSIKQKPASQKMSRW